MTLNITLAGASGVYVATDFRLTSSSGGFLDSAAKHLSLSYFNFLAAVVYCGLGSTRLFIGPHESEIQIREWVADWLLAHNNQDPSFDEIAELIREKGSELLSNITPLSRHSFIMAGYDEGKARVTLISNYDRIDGPKLARPGNELLTSTITPNAPRIKITGLESAVSQADRKYLRNLMKVNTEPQAIRQAIYEVNKRASHSPQAANGISPGCLVDYMFPTETGAGGEFEYFGQYDRTTDPTLIMGGMDISALARKIAEREINGQTGDLDLSGLKSEVDAERNKKFLR